MAENDQWLEHYGDTHRGFRWPLLYWLAMPALIIGLLGLLWTLPVPAAFTRISPLLNWGSVFLLSALVYYFLISVPLALGMLPLVSAIFVVEIWLAQSPTLPGAVAAGLTVAGLAGLYAGHASRGGLGAWLREVQLLMIAPLWLLSRLYRRLGIPL